VIFFFQAEDGIRVLYVTGVQTCALPICTSSTTSRPAADAPPARLVVLEVLTPRDPAEDHRLRDPPLLRPHREVHVGNDEADESRSEERRVGKEWSIRWAASQSEEKEWCV